MFFWLIKFASVFEEILSHSFTQNNLHNTYSRIFHLYIFVHHYGDRKLGIAHWKAMTFHRFLAELPTYGR